MTTSTLTVIHLMVYVITIVYLTVLGCYMFGYRDNPLVTHGEQMAKRRLTRTMGISMFIVAFETILYLPPMILGYSGEHGVFKLLFLVVLMLSIPMIYNMMFALVQRKVNTLRWSCALGLPYLALAVWYFIAPPHSLR